MKPDTLEMRRIVSIYFARACGYHERAIKEVQDLPYADLSELYEMIQVERLYSRLPSPSAQS